MTTQPILDRGAPESLGALSSAPAPALRRARPSGRLLAIALLVVTGAANAWTYAATGADLPVPSLISTHLHR